VCSSDLLWPAIDPPPVWGGPSAVPVCPASLLLPPAGGSLPRSRSPIEVFTIADLAVHDADRSVHDADLGVHDHRSGPPHTQARPVFTITDLAVHDGAKRALMRVSARNGCQSQEREPEQKCGRESESGDARSVSRSMPHVFLQ
jgi:hypothetical protein